MNTQLCACGCGQIITQPETGRTRKYYSDACKQQGYRDRSKRVTKVVTKLEATQREDIRLYCGIGETFYNHHPVVCGPYACISPVAGRDDGDTVTEASRRNGVFV